MKSHKNLPRGVQVLQLDPASLINAIHVAAGVYDPHRSRAVLERIGRRGVYKNDDVAAALLLPPGERAQRLRGQRKVLSALRSRDLFKGYDIEAEAFSQLANYLGWPAGVSTTTSGIKDMAKHDHATWFMFWRYLWSKSRTLKRLFDGDFSVLEWRPTEVRHGELIADGLLDYAGTQLRGRQAVQFALAFYEWAGDALTENGKKKSFDDIAGRSRRGVGASLGPVKIFLDSKQEPDPNKRPTNEQLQTLLPLSYTAGVWLKGRDEAPLIADGPGVEGWIDELVDELVAEMQRWGVGWKERKLRAEFAKLDPVRKRALFFTHAGGFDYHPNFPFGKASLNHFQSILLGERKPRRPTLKEALACWKALPSKASAA